MRLFFTRACSRWQMCKINLPALRKWTRIDSNSNHLFSSSKCVLYPRYYKCCGRGKHVKQMCFERAPSTIARRNFARNWSRVIYYHSTIIAFGPRLNCVCTICRTRGYARTKLWLVKTFSAPPPRVIFATCGHGLFAPASWLIHLLLAFDGVCFAGIIFQRDMDAINSWKAVWPRLSLQTFGGFWPPPLSYTVLSPSHRPLPCF